MDPVFMGAGAFGALFVVVGAVVVVGVVLVSALVVRVLVRERRRVKDLSGLASARGWITRPEDPALGDRYGDYLPGQGRRRALNSVSATVRGVPVVAFDCLWSTSDGDGSSTLHRRHIIAVEGATGAAGGVEADLRRIVPDVEIARGPGVLLVVRRSIEAAELPGWLDAVVAATRPAVAPGSAAPGRADGPQDGPGDGPQDSPRWRES